MEEPEKKKENMTEEEQSLNLNDGNSDGELMESNQQEKSDLLESTNEATNKNNDEENMEASQANDIPEAGIKPTAESPLENVGTPVTPLTDEKTDEPQQLDNPDAVEESSSSLSIQKNASEILASIQEGAASLTLPDILPTTESLDEGTSVSTGKLELENISLTATEKAEDPETLKSSVPVTENPTQETCIEPEILDSENISGENSRSSVPDELKQADIVEGDENSQSSVATPVQDENSQCNVTPDLTKLDENSKSSLLQDENSKSSLLQDENSKSSLPQDENSKSSLPHDENSKPSIPQDENSKSSLPQDENSKSSVPQDENSKPTIPQDENSESSLPQDENSNPSLPQDENSKPTIPQDDNSKSSLSQDENSKPTIPQDENSESSLPQDENSNPSLPQDENSKPTIPQDDNSKSSLSQDENSKPTIPRDENSESSLPQDENSKPTIPQDDNSKSSLSQDENSKPLLLQDENSKPSLPQNENSKSSIPEDENSKFSVSIEEEKSTVSDKDETSQSSVIEAKENSEHEEEKMETDEQEKIASPNESATKESPKSTEQAMEVDDVSDTDKESGSAEKPFEIEDNTRETATTIETDEMKKDGDVVDVDKPTEDKTIDPKEDQSTEKSDLVTSEEMDTTEEKKDDKKEESEEKEKAKETRKEGHAKDEDSDPDVSIIEKEEVKEIVNLIDDEDDDDDISLKKVVSKPEPIVKQSSNDMGLQIASVTSGATMPVDDKPAPPAPAPAKPKSKPKQPQTCIVCGKVGRCKYNIKRNEEIKHLCDEPCFVKFKTNPTMYLKSSKQQQAEANQAPPPAKTAEKSSTNGQQKSKQAVKTCHVCQLMNINKNKPFCCWHGLDFCEEGCLQKFQNSLNTSCSLCTEVIPIQNRGLYVFKISNSDIRTLCTQNCLTEFRKTIRLCTYCNKDLSNCLHAFSAPVGIQKTFQEFCSQVCMTKYEKDLTAPDVEITTITPGTQSKLSPCAVCSKNTVPLHTVKLNNVVNKLCSAPCLQAFQYANKLTLNKCENCGKVCASEQTKSFFIQYEGNQKKFCSDRCVEIFRNANQKVVPCGWCGSKKRNFDMIERVDSNNKYQLFCTLNCLSLYRVNLQAKSNLCVCCDHCRKYTPAQYHLTMSDASVRNFCSYNCVMAFQKQFNCSGSTSAITPNTSVKNKSYNKATSNSGKQAAVAATSSPIVPIISNVVSLAPAAGQKQQVNIRNTSQVPVVIGGQKGTTIQTTTTGTQPIQQQIIVQPPAPKIMKNKSLLCKPFVQTKATSCRPSTQNKKIGTDEEPPPKPVIIPVPVPIYVPTPLAMYSTTTPQFYPVPIPIPVPIFIPTTKKSAAKILKQIKEIQNRIPADPLEAELLMMAEAVAGDKGSSDSDSDSDKGADDLPAFDEIETASPIVNKGKEGEEDMLQMALRVADEITEPIMDLEDNVQPVAVKTDPPPKPTRNYIPDDDDPIYSPPINTRQKRGAKRASRGRSSSTSRPKRQRTDDHESHHHHQQQQPVMLTQPAQPPEDANSYLKFTYGVNAWKHWVVFKNSQLEKVSKVGSGKLKLFKTDLLQCTADELNYSLCLFCKEVRKPNGEEYSPDSIYYLCLGIQQYLYENGRVDNIFSDLYYEKFSECLSEVLSHHQPKLNAAGQMLCRIEEEHLWEAKQLGAHSPYVLLNTLIYFHTKYFMMKTPQEHMNMSFTQILKHWRKGGPGKPTSGNTAGRSVTLRYYCMGPGGAAGKPKSKEGIPVYETSENLENPLRCPVKLYEFYLSKCPESIKNVNDMFYLVPERSCVPDSPVWYSTQSLASEVMTKMLNRILLVREIQEAHLHAQPIYV